jgi:hypothetical protein
MVIFHSYVKLPEGTTYEWFLGYFSADQKSSPPGCSESELFTGENDVESTPKLRMDWDNGYLTWLLAYVIYGHSNIMVNMGKYHRLLYNY